MENSRRKADAANTLRAWYQACAVSTSRIAAGWKSTRIQPVDESLTNLFPWNGFNCPGIKFGHALFDFCCPRCVDIRIRLALRRFDEQTRQRRPILFRQIRRFLPYVGECPAHDLEFTPLSQRRDVNDGIACGSHGSCALRGITARLALLQKTDQLPTGSTDCIKKKLRQNTAAPFETFLPRGMRCGQDDNS